MSNMINVDGSDDPSYRYKMPRLVSKVEGRGNGVKTVLVNCVDVAKSLNRSPAQVTKFFGCELGAMSKYEDKIERSLVNGAFENKVLQEALTVYIQKFILCPSCGNPETVEELKGKKKSAMIMLNCKACGAYEEADNAHKLVTFIVKEMKSDDGGDPASKKEERRKKRNEKNKKKEKDGDDENGEKKKKKKKKSKKDTDTADGSIKKKKKKKSKKISSSESNEGKSIEDDDDEGIVEDLGALTVNDIAALNSCVDKVNQLLAGSTDGVEILKAIEEQQVSSGLRRAERVPIVVYALFNPQMPLAALMEKTSIVKGVVKGVEDCFLSTKDVEIDILLCIEECVARADESERAELTKKVPIIVKTLYDEDLLSEETIVEWYQNELEPTKYKHLRCIVDKEDAENMKKATTPIIEWLQQSDESESESEESDDEDEE